MMSRIYFQQRQFGQKRSRLEMEEIKMIHKNNIHQACIKIYNESKRKNTEKYRNKGGGERERERERK